MKRARAEHLHGFAVQTGRTTYLLDVRTPEEFGSGHGPVFATRPAASWCAGDRPHAPVRSDRLVLVDDNGVRANVSASWLAQMGWDAWVLDGLQRAGFHDTVPAPQPAPDLLEPAQWITPADLADRLQREPPGRTVVLGMTTSANYTLRHVPGAWFVLRSQLAQALQSIPQAPHYVLTCGNSLLACYPAADVARITGAKGQVLEGGTLAWIAQSLPLEQVEIRLASSASTATAAPMKAPTARARRCRPIWTGSSGW